METMMFPILAALLLLLVSFNALPVHADSAAHITVIKPKQGGILGGTRLSILGDGFDIRGRSNDIFIGDSENGIFCDPVPNECHENRIVCITEPFKGRGVFPLAVKSNGFLAECLVSSGCTFEYVFEQTPQIDSIWPEWLAPPQPITVYGRRFSQGDPTVANFDFSFWFGEEERCDLGRNVLSWSSFVCDVETIFPGSQDIKIQNGASGYAANPHKFQVSVYPSITGVEPTESSTAGGQLVTVRGSTFSREAMENEVYIHGAPCAVNYVSQHLLTCITSPHALTAPVTPPAYAPGKVLVEWWRDITKKDQRPEIWVGSEMYLTPQGSAFVSRLGGEYPFPRSDLIGARFTTFFVPLQTGNHTFSITGDDAAELWLSYSESEVPRVKTQVVVPQDPLYKNRIAYFDSYTGGNFSLYDTQKSDPQYLVAGRKYWLQVLLGNGYGAVSYGVQIIQPDTTVIVNPSGSYLAYRARYEPPVSVTSRKVRALYASACRDYNACAMHYTESSTPVVTAVTPSVISTVGATLTISGSNFAGTVAGNNVTLSGNLCKVSSATTSQIICSTTGVPAGINPVVVSVLNKGYARGSATVTAQISISTVANDGSTITVQGNGFRKSKFRIVLDGSDCSVLSVNSTTVTCKVDGEIGGGSKTVEARGTGMIRTAKKANGFMYSQPYIRPGTTKDPLPASITPTTGSVNGGTILIVVAPSQRFTDKTGLTVTMGPNGAECKIFQAFSSRVMCRTPYVSNPATYNVTLTYPGGSIIAGRYTYTKYVVDVSPLSIGPSGGNIIYITVGSLGADLTKYSLSYLGDTCDYLDWNDGDTLRCFLKQPPPTLPSLPVIASYTSATSQVLSNFYITKGVTATAGDGIRIPANGYLMSRAKYTRPFVFRAKVRPSASFTTSSASCIRMFALAEDPSALYTGFQGYAGFGAAEYGLMVGYYRPTGTVQNSGNLQNIGLDPSRFADWRIEVGPYHVDFYVDDTLVQRQRSLEFTTGEIGFHPCQDIVVDNIVVEDLYPRVLQVNVSGFPLDVTSCPFVDDYIDRRAEVITALSSSTFTPGSSITVLGANFRADGNDILYIFNSDSDPLKHDSIQLCSSYTRDYSFLVCVVSNSVPKGSYTMKMRTYDGFLPRTFPVTINPVVLSVNPAVGSEAGALITILGGAFTRDRTQVAVTVGTTTCTVVRSTYTEIVCEMPAQPSGASLGAMVVVVTVSSVNAASTCDGGCTFKYTVDSMPVITSVTPATLTYPTQDFVLYGTNFVGYFSAVRVGPQDCWITWSSTTAAVCRMRTPVTSFGSLPVSFAVFAKGYATGSKTVTVSKGIGQMTAGGSTQGNAEVAISGYGFDPSTGFTQVVGTDYSSASAKDAWSGAAEEYTSCPAPFGRMLGGYNTYGWRTALTKTVSTSAPHSYLRFTANIASIDGWSDVEKFYVTVDNKQFAFDTKDSTCVKDEFQSPCGQQHRDYTDCVMKLQFIIPHTASSAVVKLSTAARYSSSGRSWGIMSYNIGIASSMINAVKIGSVDCPITYIDSSYIKCTAAPQAAGAYTLSVTESGNALSCNVNGGCTYTYGAASNTPLPTALTFSTIDRLSNGQQLNWNDVDDVLVTNGTTVTMRKLTTSSNWDAGATSSQKFYYEDNLRGIHFALGDRVMAGLTSGTNEGASYSEIEFAWYHYDDVAVVYERGEWVQQAPKSYIDGQDLSIIIDYTNNQIIYLQEEQLVYVSNNAITWPLRVDVSLSTVNTTIQNMQLITSNGASAYTPVVIAGTAFPTFTATKATIDGSDCPLIHSTEGHFTCKYLATSAVAGSDHSVVVTNQWGQSSAVTLKLLPMVNKLSTVSGTRRGGSIITVYGGGFSQQPTVQIGSAGACTVRSFTYSQVVCETPQVAQDGEYNVSVTVGSYNAVCLTNGDMGVVTSTAMTCPKFKFVDEYTITAVTPSTELEPGQMVTVTGTNFPLNNPVQLVLGDGYCSADAAVSATMVVCTVASNVIGGSYAAYLLFVPSGKSTTFTVGVRFAVTSVTPSSTGANGGAMVTISGAGLGDETSTATLSLRTSGNTDICTTITRQGRTVVCKTTALTFSGTQILSVGGQTVGVALSASASATPSITSVSPASVARGDVITISGTLLDTIT